jgi:hypothetical protein
MRLIIIAKEREREKLSTMNFTFLVDLKKKENFERNFNLTKLAPFLSN